MNTQLADVIPHPKFLLQHHYLRADVDGLHESDIRPFHTKSAPAEMVPHVLRQ